MSIYSSVFNELKKYGERITVTTEEGKTSFIGVLEPLLYKNKLYLGGEQLPQGLFDSGNYLLICPADVKLPVLGTAFFEAKEKKFVLKRSETVTMSSKPVYVWAVLSPYVRHKEEDVL
ncbi:MAG: hypothetical protein IKK10_00935 [Clostridia bacterium]|nr:hypothetical protein [Clostridia bacterium]